MEELSCDIAYVLQNKDFSVLQKLVSYCYSIRAKIAAKVADAATYETGKSVKCIVIIQLSIVSSINGKVFAHRCHRFEFMRGNLLI